MIRYLLLSISAGVLFLSLGLFSPDAGRSVAPTVPAASPASDKAAVPAARPELPAIPDALKLPAPASGAQPCAAPPIDAPSSSAPTTVQAACPSGTVFTCCRCGGCGCRPMRISPTNWCAC